MVWSSTKTENRSLRTSADSTSYCSPVIAPVVLQRSRLASMRDLLFGNHFQQFGRCVRDGLQRNGAIEGGQPPAVRPRQPKQVDVGQLPVGREGEMEER